MREVENYRRNEEESIDVKMIILLNMFWVVIRGGIELVLCWKRKVLEKKVLLGRYECIYNIGRVLWWIGK